MEVLAVSKFFFLFLIVYSGSHGVTRQNRPTRCPVKCECNEQKLSVICKNISLHQVPSNLSFSIRYLDLSNNRISGISNNTFIGFENMTMLILSDNIISTIEEDAFKGLIRLLRLGLQGNRLGIGTLENSVSGIVKQHLPSLQQLYVNKMSYPLHRYSLELLRGKSSLSLLDFSQNEYMCVLPDGVFSGLILQTLNLEFCKCPKINPKAFINLTLATLRLNFNDLTGFPDFNNSLETVSFCQTLAKIYITNNMINKLQKSDFQGFESLKLIDMNFNTIRRIPNGCFEHLTSLHTLSVGHNRITIIDALAFNSTTLQTLHLEVNPFILYSSDVDVFRHAVGIKKIYLSHCHLQGEHMSDLLFQNITSLEVLQVEKAWNFGGGTLGKNAFRGLKNLRELFWINVGLKYIHKETFVGLNSLRNLYLSNNKLRTITASTFPPNVLRNITKLDLSNNPFDCSCELFWFIDWIKDNKRKLVGYGAHQYACSSPKSKQGALLEDLQLSPEECLARPMSISVWVILSLCSFQLFITLVVSVVYRFRWHLRLYFFYLCTWLRPTPPRRTQSNFTFDLFVSHNANDAAWVKNVLLPELEIHSQPPFKVCVYSRNWLVGRNIDECIIESLEQSRKTLLLVTNAFAESEWCQFEMTMAQHKLIEKDNDNLLLAVMEDIESINMTPRLRLMMKRKIHLRWTDDEVGKRLFWKRLKQMLRSENRSLFEAIPSTDELRSVLE